MTSPESIIAEVALITGVPVSAITGDRRTSRICWARFLTYAALRQAFDWWSLPDIAAAVNRVHHGTVINGLKRFHQLSGSNPAFQSLAHELQLIP